VIKAAQSEVLTDGITKKQQWCIVTAMWSTPMSGDCSQPGVRGVSLVRWPAPHVSPLPLSATAIYCKVWVRN